MMRGCDAAIHTVSNFRAARDPPALHWRTNVDGTRNVLRAAQAAGLRRVVHCSTIGVHGDVAATPGDERSPFAPGDLYQETKAAAEVACRDALARGSTEVVIVRPCSIYGPGDLRMLKMFRLLAQGRFLCIGDGSANFHAVYIDDLVQGFERALDRPGISGEAFIVGGDTYLPLVRYLETAAAAAGGRLPRWRVPYAPVHALACACEALCVPLGVEPPLHRRRVRFFRNNRAFRIDKARRRLGYAPSVTLEDGMRRTVAWYRGQGLLA
jgi:nucleoside-diphosphate-sugar epimerase